MKKITVINLLVCLFMLAMILISAKNSNQDCTAQCPSTEKAKQQKKIIHGGADNDDQFFQFNRMYIKI